MRGKAKVTPHAGGRPSKYRPEFDKQAYKLCLLGATNEQMADFFGVATSQIDVWRRKHPTFQDALKSGKAGADAVIAKSLFHRAKGYSHKEDCVMQYKGSPVIIPTVKHYPPDTVACIFWLKNRRPDLWRDKHEHEHVGDAKRPIAVQTLQDAFAEAATKPDVVKTIEGLFYATNGGANGRAAQN